MIATNIVLGANGPECMMCCFYNKCCCSCLWDSLLLAVIEERPKQAAVQVIEDSDEKQLVEFKCRGKLQREQRKSLTGWHMLLHLKRAEATNGPSIWSAYSIKQSNAFKVPESHSLYLLGGVNTQVTKRRCLTCRVICQTQSINCTKRGERSELTWFPSPCPTR